LIFHGVSSPDNELVAKSKILTNSNRDRLKFSEEAGATFEIGFAACPDPQISESLIRLSLRYRGRALLPTFGACKSRET